MCQLTHVQNYACTPIKTGVGLQVMYANCGTLMLAFILDFLVPVMMGMLAR